MSIKHPVVKTESRNLSPPIANNYFLCLSNNTQNKKCLSKLLCTLGGSLEWFWLPKMSINAKIFKYNFSTLRKAIKLYKYIVRKKYTYAIVNTIPRYALT